MKKFQFYLAAITLGCLSTLAVVSFVIVFLGFTGQYFTSIDLGALTAFYIVFWLSAHMLVPTVRDLYDEYTDDIVL